MTHTSKPNLEPVNLLRRLAAILYDYLIIISFLLIATIFWTAAGITETHSYYPLYIGFVNLTPFLYFSWCWTHNGQTVGMRCWKMRLLSTRADNFSWARAITRSITATVSLILLGVGFLWGLFDKEKMTWHDRASDARLVHI